MEKYKSIILTPRNLEMNPTVHGSLGSSDLMVFSIKSRYLRRSINPTGRVFLLSHTEILLDWSASPSQIRQLSRQVSQMFGLA